jgi:hypothetical protein
MYALKISHGSLTIRPGDDAGCEIWLNDRCIRECSSANEAARFVAQRRTGNEEVDNEDCSFPPDIDGWRWISVFQPESVFQQEQRVILRPFMN